LDATAVSRQDPEWQEVKADWQRQFASGRSGSSASSSSQNRQPADGKAEVIAASKLADRVREEMRKSAERGSSEPSPERASKKDGARKLRALAAKLTPTPLGPIAEDDLEPVEFYTGARVFPAMLEGIGKAKQSISMYCYCADFNPLFFELTRLIAAGVVGRFIFDKTMFFSSSCARQAERVHALYVAGNAADLLRLYQPPHGGFAGMHVKTTIIDEKVILTGSPNPTHNGLENNKEHYLRMTQESVVRAVTADFDALWEESQPVTGTMVDLMNAKAVESMRKKVENAGQHARNRRSVSLNRSLSSEMNRAGG
jgi:phosphatidylserine/phosphatidylglycerophosphate/cardiolipin synthase-like enzyme